jgi:hypothetical protein
MSELQGGAEASNVPSSNTRSVIQEVMQNKLVLVLNLQL